MSLSRGTPLKTLLSPHRYPTQASPASPARPTISSLINDPIPGNIFANQLALTVYRQPTVLHANDQYNVVYELFLANGGANPIRLNGINIEYQGGSHLLTGDELAEDLVEFRMAASVEEEFFEPENTRIEMLEPGKNYIVYVGLSFDRRPPRSLQHTLITENLEISTEPILIDHNLGPIIAPPLRGEGWVALNGPSNNSVHRRSYIIDEGKIYFSELYAVDWVKIENGSDYQGDGTTNQDYYAYGQEIFSVADGVVVESVDNLPDNAPNSRGIPIDGLTIGGNTLLIKSNGFYHFYAHLIPGSQLVKVGDRVKVGQRIASLGNSGNSSQAHLHFEIVPEPYPLTSDGIPYRFDYYILQETTGTGDDTTLTGQERGMSQQMVIQNQVVTFI
jgi:hypothetical protein